MVGVGQHKLIACLLCHFVDPADDLGEDVGSNSGTEQGDGEPGRRAFSCGRADEGAPSLFTTQPALVNQFGEGLPYGKTAHPELLHQLRLGWHHAPHRVLTCSYPGHQGLFDHGVLGNLGFIGGHVAPP